MPYCQKWLFCNIIQRTWFFPSFHPWIGQMNIVLKVLDVCFKWVNRYCFECPRHLFCTGWKIMFWKFSVLVGERILLWKSSKLILYGSKWDCFNFCAYCEWFHQCGNPTPILLYRTFPHAAHYTVRVLVSFSVGHVGTGCDRQADQPGRNPATTPCSRTAQGKQTSQTPQEGYLCIANQPPALSFSLPCLTVPRCICMCMWMLLMGIGSSY